MASSTPSNTIAGSNNKNDSVSAATVAAAKAFTGEKCKTSEIRAIQETYNDIVKDPKGLNAAANYVYQSLLDDAAVGIFLEVHHLRKSGNLAALDGVAEADPETAYRIVDLPNYDIFGISTAKKSMDCNCPNCDRPVSAARFAPHLEKCMGMGRASSRIARRRLATKEGTSASSSSSSSYLQTNAGGTDDDDVDWSSEKRRKKTSQNSRNNGSKKNNGKSF